MRLAIHNINKLGGLSGWRPLRQGDAKPAQCCPLACCSSLPLPLPPAPSLPLLLLRVSLALKQALRRISPL